MARAKTARRAAPRTGPRTTGYAARIGEGWIAPGGRIVPDLVRWTARAALERLAIRVQLATGEEAAFYRVNAVRQCQDRDEAQGRLAGCALESEGLEKTINRTLEREREKAKRDAEREREKARKVEARRARELAKQRERERRATERAARRKPAKGKPARGKPAPGNVNLDTVSDVQRVTTWPASWLPQLKANWVTNLSEKQFGSGEWASGGVTWLDLQGRRVPIPADAWVASTAAMHGLIDTRGAQLAGLSVASRVRESLASYMRAMEPRRGSKKRRGVVVVPYATATEVSRADAVKDRQGNAKELRAPVLVLAPAEGGPTRYAMDAACAALFGPRAKQVVAVLDVFLFLDGQGWPIAMVAARKGAPKGV